MDNKETHNSKVELENALNKFISKNGEDLECNEDGCIVKTDKSIVEKINKKIIIEDGRQLLT
jgi:hypothetical protein